MLELLPSDPANAVQRDLYTVARLELDMSTAAGFPSTFATSELPSLVAELVNLGLEIAQRGDIP